MVLSDFLPLFGAIILIALLAGFASGLLGIGGGIFLVPTFLMLFSGLGYDTPQLMQLCVGTSTACVMVTTSRAAFSHYRRGALDVALFRAWGPFIAVGAVVGVLATRKLSSDQLAVVFGIVGILLGASNLLGPREIIGLERPLSRATSLCGGITVGGISSMMGIGGGTLGVPLLRLMRRSVHRAVATSAAFGAILSMPAALMQAFLGRPNGVLPPFTLGYVNLPTFMLITVLSGLTVPLGVSAAHRLSEQALRMLFAGTIILLSIRVLLTA